MAAASGTASRLCAGAKSAGKERPGLCEPNAARQAGVRRPGVGAAPSAPWATSLCARHRLVANKLMGLSKHRCLFYFIKYIRNYTSF